MHAGLKSLILCVLASTALMLSSPLVFALENDASSNNNVPAISGDGKPEEELKNTPYTVQDVIKLIVMKSFKNGVYSTAGEGWGGVWWATNGNYYTFDSRALALDHSMFGDNKNFYISNQRSKGGAALDALIEAMSAKVVAEKTAKLKLANALIDQLNSISNPSEELENNIEQLTQLLAAIAALEPEFHQMIADEENKKNKAREASLAEKQRIKAEAAEREAVATAKLVEKYQNDVDDATKKFEKERIDNELAIKSLGYLFEEFKDNGDGTITDPRNGLIWQKCSMGQTWNGKGCDGEVKIISWFDAMSAAKSNKFVGMSDWRLPTDSEFKSVLRRPLDYQIALKKETGIYNEYIYKLRSLVDKHFSYGKNREKEFEESNKIEDLRKQYSQLEEKRKEKIIEAEKLIIVSEKLAFPISNINANLRGQYWSITRSPNSGLDYESFEIDNMGGRSVLASFLSGGIGVERRLYQWQARFVRGGQIQSANIAEFEHEYQRVSQANAEMATIQKAREMRAKEQLALQKKQQIELDQRSNEYERKTASFRKKLKVGDKAVQGLVMQVNGNAIKVQFNDPFCDQRFSNNSCAHWVNTAAEKWMQRDELRPPY